MKQLTQSHELRASMISKAYQLLNLVYSEYDARDDEEISHFRHNVLITSGIYEASINYFNFNTVRQTKKLALF